MMPVTKPELPSVQIYPLTGEAPVPYLGKELTDIDSVRQFMQKTLSDKLQDDDLEILIAQASEAITRLTGREFTPTNAATRSFEWRPASVYDVLDLAPYELRTVTAVQLDPEAEGGTELTSAHYRLRPYPPKEGTFFGLRLSGEAVPAPASSTIPIGEPFPFFTRRVDITGDWGMTQVPEEIVKAANATVKAWAEIKHDAGAPSPEFAPSFRAGDDIPPEIARALERRWKRPEALA